MGYLYEIEPIDHSWEYLPKAHMSGFLFNVLEFAKKSSLWEGDFRELPHIFYIPDPDTAEFQTCYIWKQLNNGMCFVYSPVRLKHFEDSTVYDCYFKEYNV